MTDPEFEVYGNYSNGFYFENNVIFEQKHKSQILHSLYQMMIFWSQYFSKKHSHAGQEKTEKIKIKNVTSNDISNEKLKQSKSQ